MTLLTIEDFWKQRFSSIKTATPSPVKGWNAENVEMSAFMEAPLVVNSELTSSDANKAVLILVSAPGAVGKSTLAKQIAAQTGAVLVDLAEAEPVGGNTTSGGLAKSGLYSGWQNGETALLIDGLDEARLRVTQESFEAFLNDIADLAVDRDVPTVIFGRTGSIQDAWITLSGRQVPLTVLEIGFYGRDASLAFATARLRDRSPDDAHAQVQDKAVELLLDGLRAQTDSDGDRFAGYAPVLQAVADRVLAEDNPAALVAQIEKGERPVTLRSVVFKIMEREQGKLEGIPLRDQNLVSQLYLAEEQLSRLVARAYGIAPPPLPPMSAEDAQAYSSALDSWLPEHPFLDGNVKASSAVFEAIIAVHALKNKPSSEAAVNVELSRGIAANPFLSEFYLEDDRGGAINLPAEHIGIVYSSLRATLSFGDNASLQIEGREDAVDEEALRAEVEISVGRQDADHQRVLLFQTEQVGKIRLGKYIEDVDINAQYADVEIGTGPETLLVAPVNIQSSSLTLNADKLIIESSRTGEFDSVYIESSNFYGERMVTLPVIRGNTNLTVSWPNSQVHPWTRYAVEPFKAENPKVAEGLRRFRKFITAFRSHSKGNLARYRDKLDHERMTKGSGQVVLDALKRDGIIYPVGAMYYLNPDKLGAVTGANYIDIAAQLFSESTISYVSAAVGD